LEREIKLLIYTQHLDRNHPHYNDWEDDTGAQGQYQRRPEKKYPLRHLSWPWFNEIGPALESFLHHPKARVLYAYANEDGILKPENTTRGALESPFDRDILRYLSKETVGGKDVASQDRCDSAVDLGQKKPVRGLEEMRRAEGGNRLWRSHSILLRPKRMDSADSSVIPKGNRLKYPFQVPCHLDYGHVDVLVGRKAHFLWSALGEWLTQESARGRHGSV
jgi:hypothetical protein